MHFFLENERKDVQPLPTYYPASPIPVKLLSKAMRKYESTVLEMAALVWMCRTEQKTPPTKIYRPSILYLYLSFL